MYSHDAGRARSNLWNVFVPDTPPSHRHMHVSHLPSRLDRPRWSGVNGAIKRWEAHVQAERLLLAPPSSVEQRLVGHGLAAAHQHYAACARRAYSSEFVPTSGPRAPSGSERATSILPRRDPRLGRLCQPGRSASSSREDAPIPDVSRLDPRDSEEGIEQMSKLAYESRSATPHKTCLRRPSLVDCLTTSHSPHLPSLVLTSVAILPYLANAFSPPHPPSTQTCSSTLPAPSCLCFQLGSTPPAAAVFPPQEGHMMGSTQRMKSDLNHLAIARTLASVSEKGVHGGSARRVDISDERGGIRARSDEGVIPSPSCDISGENDESRSKDATRERIATSRSRRGLVSLHGTALTYRVISRVCTDRPRNKPLMSPSLGAILPTLLWRKNRTPSPS